MIHSAYLYLESERGPALDQLVDRDSGRVCEEAQEANVCMYIYKHAFIYIHITYSAYLHLKCQRRPALDELINGYSGRFGEESQEAEDGHARQEREGRVGQRHEHGSANHGRTYGLRVNPIFM